MNWFKRVRSHVPSEGEHARKQAESGLEKAEADLENTKAQTVMYEELGKSLRKMREQNHFADGILHTFSRGDRK